MMKKMIATLGMLALLLPTGAALAENPTTLGDKATRSDDAPKRGGAERCLSREQADALLIYAFPAILEGITKTCRRSLPEGASLRRSGVELADRYRVDGQSYWPKAREAFGVISGGEALPPILGEKVEKSLIESVIGDAIGNGIKLEDCAMASEAVELISPLPVTNLGKLTALIIATSEKDKKDKSKRDSFKICEGPVAN